MTTPRPELTHIFTPMQIESGIDCFFCPETYGGWTIHVNLPSRKTNFFVHVSCFEQLGWSMARYVVDNSEKFGAGGTWNSTSSGGTS